MIAELAAYQAVTFARQFFQSAAIADNDVTAFAVEIAELFEFVDGDRDAGAARA